MKGVLILCLMLLGSVFGKFNVKENSTLNHFITFEKAELIYNDHVGNEWNYYAIIDDELLKVGDTIELCSPLNILVNSILEETNEKHIDRTFKITNIADISNFKLPKSLTVDLRITESNGRYAGNEAAFRYYFTLF